MEWGPIVARRLQLLLDGFNCCSTASIVTRRLQLLVDATRLVYGWRQNNKTTTRQDSVELEASLAPA